MKKLLALLITVILIVGCLAACNTQPENIENSEPETTQSETTETNSTEADANDETVSEPVTESKNDTTASKVPQIQPDTSKNYFLNENNNFYDANAVSVRPKHVYWNNGTLIAVCYVVNGFSHPVFNVNVKSLKLSNKNGVIASASFGVLKDVVINPYSHVEWTFKFPAECIEKYGADITSLIYHSSVENDY